MTRRKPDSLRWIVLVLVLLAGLGGWSWYRATRAVERVVTLFYTDPQAMYLVPVTSEQALPKDDAPALAKMLSELTQAPAGLQPTLPAGTVAEVQRISHGQANVTLRLPSTLGSGGERLLAGAVVKTAASLGSVREVRLQLRDREGSPYESQHLDLSTPLSPTDPGVENLYLEGAQQGLMVTLYYTTPDGRYLVPLRRPLPPAYRTQPLEGSFQLLVSGPPAELAGILGPSVPANPGIGWGGVSQSVARILWPQDEPAPSDQALRAFALTLTEFDGIRQVSLTRADHEIAHALRPEAVNLAAPAEAGTPEATASVTPAP